MPLEIVTFNGIYLWGTAHKNVVNILARYYLWGVIGKYVALIGCFYCDIDR